MTNSRKPQSEKLATGGGRGTNEYSRTDCSHERKGFLSRVIVVQPQCTFFCNTLIISHFDTEAPARNLMNFSYTPR